MDEQSWQPVEKNMNRNGRVKLSLTKTIPYLMIQKRLILALYTEKSIKTARVPRSSHKLSWDNKREKHIIKDNVLRLRV